MSDNYERMTRDQAIAFLRRMTAAWRVELSDDEARVVLGYLRRHDAAIVTEALDDLEQSTHRFPSIAQLQDACRRAATHRSNTRGLPAGREPSLLDPEMHRKVQELSAKLQDELRRASGKARARVGDPNSPIGPAGQRANARVVVALLAELGAAFDLDRDAILAGADDRARLVRFVALELARLRCVCDSRDLAPLFNLTSDKYAAVGSLAGWEAIENDPDVRAKAARAWSRAFGDAPPFAVTEDHEAPPDPEPAAPPEHEEVEA